VRKRFLPEVIALLLVFLLAFLISGKPDRSKILSSRAEKRQPLPALPEKPEGLKIIRPESVDQTLKDRNIFETDGAYLKPGETKKAPFPANPYSLIGILEGKERKAVFRDYTGAILVLTKGKKLIDEAVITRIDLRSVVLKKEDQERELKVFQYPNPRPLIIKTP
jgi:hypothetical protein